MSLIIKINLYGNTFNKIINASFQFDTYLNYLKNATRYVFQLMQDNPNRVIFLKTEENTAFIKKWTSLVAKLGKTKKSNFYRNDSWIIIFN